MADGVLYKANATTWSKSTAKKFTASAVEDGIIKHANASTWFKNYPMEQYFTQQFNATWSQGWKGDGTRLDEGTWNEDIMTGSTANAFRGMIGFNQAAIQSFLGSGNFGSVTSARLLINCEETSTTGSPDLDIGKHSYNSLPAGTWTGENTDFGDYSQLHVNNQALGGYWVTLNPTQITLADGRTAIGGVALRGHTNLDEDYARWNGVKTFNSILEVTVYK